MTSLQMKRARTARQWTQAELAMRLGVSQGYVCLLERGQRPVPAPMAATLVRLLDMSPSTLPASADSDAFDTDGAVRALAALGDDRFAERPRRRELRNPAEVILRCLRAPDVDARVVEGLVRVLVAHADLDWAWLERHAKVDDLQNRLGFLVSLAAAVAQREGLAQAGTHLVSARAVLERSRLAVEGAFRTSLTDAERRWLRQHRPPEAAHWNLLTNLTVADIRDAA
jgi:transcriptional regulator with XRE-family HTH domain